MSTKFLFDRNLYIKKQGPLLISAILFSFILDLLFIWYLSLGLPSSVVSKSDVLHIWKITFWFLILINALIFKTWTIYGFCKKLSKWQSGYVEITDNEILHYVEKNEISQNRVKMEFGYVPDESKEIFYYVLIYRISRIDSYEKLRSGKLKIKGKIEMDCLDEYLGMEMGVDDHRIVQIKDHNIPAFYEGMETIQLKLDEMAIKRK